MEEVAKDQRTIVEHGMEVGVQRVVGQKLAIPRVAVETGKVVARVAKEVEGPGMMARRYVFNCE